MSCTRDASLAAARRSQSSAARLIAPRRFCAPLKEAGHINVKNKRCEADSCETQANYGSEAEDLIRFCKPHSRDGGVVLTRLRCVAPGCDGPRSFGTDGVALDCKEHRGQDFTSRKVLRARMRAAAEANGDARK